MGGGPLKLGIIGLSGSGKSTIFEALTGNVQGEGHKGEARIAVVKVPDDRVDLLSRMYNPKKTIFAQVDYYLPAKTGGKKDQNMWVAVRDCDAFVLVVRNFKQYGMDDPQPEKNRLELDQDMIISDQMVVEKRLERLELDGKRGKTVSQDEITLLQKCLSMLENETPLRDDPEIATSPLLRGYAFVSAKPVLTLFNNDDDDDTLPAIKGGDASNIALVIKGKLEQELSQMSEEEAKDFLEEFNITVTARDLVIQRSYDLLGLISFFTVGEDEVRAWTIKTNTDAVDAAEVIHSDIKKGFIRAEVLSYTDLMDAGSYQEARKKGTVRLEGKTYKVQDGDIINFRFNV